MSENAHTATNLDQAISAALIAASVAVLVAALQVTFTSLQSLSGPSFWFCLVLTLAGLTALIASCVYGGRGMAYTHKPGATHPFNLQAISLIAGTLLLIGVLTFATATIASSKKADKKAESAKLAELVQERAATLEELSSRLTSLESRIQFMEDSNALAAKERGNLSNRISTLEQAIAPLPPGDDK